MKTTRAVLVGLLVVSLGLIFLAIAQRDETPETVGPRTGLDVLVVAIDGLDWFMLSHLVRSGRLPTFERFMRSSFPGEIEAELPVLPDVGWTTLADGIALDPSTAEVTPDGVRLYGRAPLLARSVVNGGGKALVVGWPATWPAADFGAVVVAAYEPRAENHETALTPSVFPEAPATVVPADLVPEVDDLVSRTESELGVDFRRTIYDGPEPDGEWGEHLDAARWAFLADEANVNVAARMIAELEPDLALVYLGGLDAVSHRFIGPAAPFFSENALSSNELMSEVLVNYYEYLDSAIARLRTLYGENAVYVVCSAYGVNPEQHDGSIRGSHSEARPGVFLMDGPRIQGRASTVPMATADVAPTIMAALGVAIPTEVDGRIIPEALPEGLLEAVPPLYQDAGEHRPVEPSSDERDALDRAAEDRAERIRSGR